MAYFLFIDESGHDERESPYAVLAGVAVQDERLWQFIDAIVKAEHQHFGLRYGQLKEEFKGRKFLKRKVFRHANQEPEIDPDERRVLAHDCLLAGPTATRKQISALAQAKIAFVNEVIDLATYFGCSAFASIVLSGAPRPSNDVLRKDYSYLFERFYYFLEDKGLGQQGVVVFDELEKTQSKLLIGQMEKYFIDTSRGRERSRQIVPQPFFVHSDLTTMVQVADLIAYVIAWAVRIPRMTAPSRTEIHDIAEKVLNLRYRAIRNIQGNPNFGVWSFVLIEDLRGADEKNANPQGQ